MTKLNLKKLTPVQQIAAIDPSHLLDESRRALSIVPLANQLPKHGKRSRKSGKAKRR